MVDYTKWKNIEISDDEDDQHPNIDKHSLNKWRHEARLKRMQEFEEKKLKNSKDLKDCREKVEKLRLKSKDENDEQTKKDMENEEKRLKKLEEEEAKIKKEERTMPWNVDTISKESWSKTAINKPRTRQDRSKLSDEEIEKQYQDFVKENGPKIKRFGLLAKWEDCKAYLLEEPQLCCEEGANFLTIHCLNLEIEEKHDLMVHIAKQAVALQYILELAKQLDCDPRNCISAFFSRIQTMDKEYVKAFEEELEAFKKRIENRAAEKIANALKEIEEEERKKRLGPGGLDPAEVYNTLPEKLRECFDSQDIEKLKETIGAMPAEEAALHMKRCVDSGLWVPDANSKS